MIRFTDVCFAYDETPVLTNLTFECPPGSAIWLTGANGTGKTTAIHLALGLITPTSGQVESPTNTSAVFQENRLCEHLTAVANVRLGLQRKTTNQELLGELAQAGLPSGEAIRPVSQLSGGQRRRVALVRALLRQSDILCLDEPFTGVDEPSLDDLVTYTLARLSNRSVLLVCHDPDLAAAFNPTAVNLPRQ